MAQGTPHWNDATSTRTLYSLNHEEVRTFQVRNELVVGGAAAAPSHPFSFPFSVPFCNHTDNSSVLLSKTRRFERWATDVLVVMMMRGGELLMEQKENTTTGAILVSLYVYYVPVHFVPA